MVVEIQNTNAIQRLDAQGTDGQEISLQCAIIAKQHPAYDADDIIYFAGEILKVAKNIRATDTPRHATTIGATTEYYMYWARFNNQGGRREMELLKREACIYLRKVHPVLVYIAHLRRGWDDLVFPDFGTLSLSSGT